MPKKKTTQKKYYDIKDLLKLGEKDKDIKYFMAFGERSAGKSTSCAALALEDYVKNGKTSGFARRWDDDWGSNVASTYFDVCVATGMVRTLTNNVWDNVYYFGHKWYLCKFDEEKGKMVKDDKPFAYAFALNTWEKSKGGQFPTINKLIMEEFITNTRYIGSDCSEFNMYLNLVSTLARDKADFTNILIGNTIRRYGSPYFISMGIEKGVLGMEPGQTIVFKNPNRKLKIAVEYTDPPKDGKKSDILFDFPSDEASLQITSGSWQVSLRYPTLPLGTKIKPMDIVFKYYLIYRDKLLEADVVLQENKFYTFFHKKTTELKDTENDIIFDQEYHLEPNYRRDILSPTDSVGMKIYEHFKKETVFCQDPEVAEILYSYIDTL